MGARPLLHGVANLDTLEEILNVPPLLITDISVVFSVGDYPKVVTTIMLEEGSQDVVSYPNKEQMKYLLSVLNK